MLHWDGRGLEYGRLSMRRERGYSYVREDDRKFYPSWYAQIYPFSLPFEHLPCRLEFVGNGNLGLIGVGMYNQDN